MFHNVKKLGKRRDGASRMSIEKGREKRATKMADVRKMRKTAKRGTSLGGVLSAAEAMGRKTEFAKRLSGNWKLAKWFAASVPLRCVKVTRRTLHSHAIRDLANAMSSLSRM